MSIIRAPRPDSGFLLISNDVLRDERISYRALGVLVNILSRPDNWRSDYRALAKPEDREGQTAVLTALKELEIVGYLVRRRRRDDSGRWVWDQIIYDTPQPAVGEPAAQAMSGKPQRGTPRAETYDCKEESKKDDHQEDVVECLTLRAREHDDRDGPETFTDWRAEDLTLFKDVICATHLESDGSTWDCGTWPVEAFYRAFQSTGSYRRLRTGRRKPIQWPGRYLNSINDTQGVEHWLLARGLTAANDPQYSWVNVGD